MRARPARRAALVAAGAAAVLGACSSTDRVAEAEEGIASVLAQRLDRPPADVAVRCPDDAELDDGSTLTCDVALDAGNPTPVAFAVDEGGVVRLTSAVIPTDAAERYLAGELATPAEGAVDVSCGDAVLLVQAVGGTFACDAVRTADAAAFVVTVEVTALDGTVRYEVAPAPATPTTPTTAPASG